MTLTFSEVLEKGVASWLRPHQKHGSRRGALDYVPSTDPPTSLSSDFQAILSSLKATGWEPEGQEEVGDEGDVIQQYMRNGAEDCMLVVLLDGRLRCINMFMYLSIGFDTAEPAKVARA